VKEPPGQIPPRWRCAETCFGRGQALSDFGITPLPAT
jgi:hypothetical protein